MKLEVVTLPLTGRDARRAFTERRCLLVTLDGGGTGEASPLPGYSPDTLEGCREALAALPEPASLADVARLPPSLPAARFALETALLARAGGLLVHLGAAPRQVPRCRLVSSVPEAAAAAFKVKIGVPGDHELLAALRARFPSVPLRLDANGVRLPLEDYARYRPELIEEPADVHASPFPVALDESLQHLGQAELRALAPRVHALVLKPMTLGGALRCLELARLAAELGLSVCVSHLHDGPVARAATLALAQALPGRVLACGI